MPRRLILAFALSLALHSALLVPGIVRRPPAAATPRMLQASLQRPPEPPKPPIPQPETEAVESIEKDTLAPEEAPVSQPAPTPPPPAAKHPAASQRYVERAQRQLSNVLAYPAEAVNRGLEGDVHLLIKLTDDGTVEEVSVASSSGHVILDDAAVKAAYRTGKFGAGPRELILPISFRLQ